MSRLIFLTVVLFSFSSFAGLIPENEKKQIEQLRSFHDKGEKEQQQGISQKEACKDVPEKYLRNCWQGYFAEGFRKSVLEGAFQANQYYPLLSDSENIKIAWSFAMGMAMASSQKMFTAKMVQDFPVPVILQQAKFKKYYMEGWAYYSYITNGLEETIQSCKKFLIQDHICQWGMGIGFFTDRKHLTSESRFSKEFISGFLYTKAFLLENEKAEKHLASKMANFMRNFLANETFEEGSQKAKCAKNKHILECSSLF